MSDDVVRPFDPAAGPAHAAAPADGGPVLRRVLLVLAGFAVLGALCAVVWEWWWRPPMGVVYEDAWYLQPSGPDFSFDSVATYVLVAVGAGLVAGVGIAIFVRGHELATLGAVALGSVLAAWVMFALGQALGPPDPQDLAPRAEDWSELPAQLDLGDSVRWEPFGTTAVLAFPVGALLGLGTTMLTTDPRRGPRHHKDGSNPVPSG